MTDETKIIYYKDEDKVPYMIKLSVAPDKATLRDVKNALNVNAKCLKFFFQTIVDDFGVVKEEISDDDMKLPFVNGRAVCWLIQIEGSLAGSDSRSQNSLIMNDFNSQNKQNEIGNENGGGSGNGNYQFTSMQSVSSNGSSISNNENMERISNNNNYRKSTNSGQIYDTLNNRKSTKLRQVTPLKDMNTDDTCTETESVISEIENMRLHHQRPSSVQINGLNGGSIRRGSTSKPQFGSFNNHNQMAKKPKQKLSLDGGNQYNGNQNYQNPNFLSHYPSNQNNFNGQLNGLNNGKSKRTSHHTNGKDITDSFSENSDDDESELGLTNEKMNRYRKGGAAPSIISSELDTTTFFDTENDDDGQFSSFTDQTNSTMSSRHYGQNRNRRRIRHKLQHSQFKANSSMHSSVSSLTDSTMSLNIITVTLNMDSVNFLGISIVGQSNKGGEGGIYVGSIMTGGAVALDGRIEPGDMILQVNEVSFENMSNDDAVRVLREAVMKPGPVKLVVAKCWDPNPQGYFTVSKQEPVRPIDPSAWVAHTQAHTGVYPIGSNVNNYAKQQIIKPAGGNQPYNNQMGKVHQYRLTHSVSTFGSNSSLTTSLADTTISTTYNNNVGPSGGNGNYNKYNNYGNNLGTTTTTNADSTRFGNEHLNLTIKTDMETLVRAMAAPDSGLEVRDRNWLKITIPNAFIGSEVVDWLFNHVEGFPDRRDARKYACDMLKYGFIRHAVNKVRFSEQCYYIFGDFNQSTLNSQMMTMNGGGGNLFTLNEENELDFDSVSELDRDTMYAPMSFPPPPPGSFNNYQHHQRLHANLNGIGGPPPPPSYLSSSSSNATSNSTSTTSNNTTTQTIATTTTAMGGFLHAAGSSSSGVGGSSMTSSNSNTTANTTSNTQSSFGGGIINSDRTNACQFYYPPPSLQMTSFSNNNTMSSLSSSMFHNNNKQNNMNTLISSQNDSQNDTANHTTQQSQYTNETFKTDFSQSQICGASFNYSSQMTPFNQNGPQSLKNENRSVKSSDNSSSGNGSDVELLSSSKSKNIKRKQQTAMGSDLKQQNYYSETQVQSTNYYEITHINQSVQSGNNTLESGSLNGSLGQKQRTLDQVPREMRLSKQSFHQAMGNPCEFFVDVM